MDDNNLQTIEEYVADYLRNGGEYQFIKLGNNVRLCTISVQENLKLITGTTTNLGTTAEGNTKPIVYEFNRDDKQEEIAFRMKVPKTEQIKPTDFEITDIQITTMQDKNIFYEAVCASGHKLTQAHFKPRFFANPDVFSAMGEFEERTRAEIGDNAEKVID